jgi:hypothetical protein
MEGPMSFEVGKRYERQANGIIATVVQTDATAESALLRLESGDEEWITSADVPGRWRLFETCPACHGSGQITAFERDKGDFSRRGIPLICPTCKGDRRVYP